MKAKTVSLGLMGVACFSVAMCISNRFDKIDKEAQKAKEEMKLKDYDRYVRTFEAADKIKRHLTGSSLMAERNKYWIEQAKIMRDSLRTDSIAKSKSLDNYQKTDSIK